MSPTRRRRPATWALEALAQLAGRGVTATAALATLEAAAPKPSKYRAERVELDGIVFASKHEAARYAELLLLVRAGRIRNLQLQPAYPLEAAAVDAAGAVRAVRVATYIADFAYDERRPGGAWAPVVEDAKGVRTPIYRLKRKWYRAQYGAVIREV